MVYDFTGIIHRVDATNEANPSFPKRNLIIKNLTDYGERYFTFQAQKDNCAKLDSFTEGMHVKVRFVVEGARQEWNGKYITSLKLLGVEPMSAGVAPAPAPSVSAPAPAPAPVAKHAEAKTWADVVAAWEVKHAGDKEGLKAICVKACPEVASAAQATGVKFIDVAASQAGSFEKMLAAIAASDSEATGMDW